MIKDRNPKIQRIKIAEIDIDAENRLRPVSEAGVESLIASINELGIIKDPIHLRRKGRGDEAQLILLAGAHRLTAAARLGWVDIPARVWADVTDDFARLMEIDDNLSGADLSNLELSVFLAERKRVYEKMHPEARRGGDRRSAKFKDQSEIISFCNSVAEKRELSKRHIENFVRIGNALTPKEVAELGGLQNPLKLKDLMELAKIGEPIIRSDVIGRLVSGEVQSVAEARDKLEPVRASEPRNADDAALAKLTEAWARAPMKVRRAFVHDFYEQITDLTSDEYERREK